VLTSDECRLTATLADLLEGTIAIHRADLQSVLAEAAREVCFGRRGHFRATGGDLVVAAIADGSEERADLLEPPRDGL
jgi:hypothetical protein